MSRRLLTFCLGVALEIGRLILDLFSGAYAKAREQTPRGIYQVVVPAIVLAGRETPAGTLQTTEKLTPAEPVSWNHPCRSSREDRVLVAHCGLKTRCSFSYNSIGPCLSTRARIFAWFTSSRFNRTKCITSSTSFSTRPGWPCLIA